MTRVDRYLNWFKNNRIVSISIVIGVVIISLAMFTNALQSIYSFFVSSEKKPSIQQKMENSPGSIQAGRDVNIKVEPNKVPPSSRSIAQFPFDLQVNRAKKRIRYLAQEYLKTDTMSLVEVVGAYGDNVLDSPQLYDWNKVMNELERQGYIKILRRTENNIEFKVLARK